MDVMKEKGNISYTDKYKGASIGVGGKLMLKTEKKDVDNPGPIYDK